MFDFFVFCMFCKKLIILFLFGSLLVSSCKCFLLLRSVYDSSG